MQWGTSNNKVTLSFDQVVLGSHMTPWNHYTSITIMLMTTKRGRLVTYPAGLLPIKSHELLITRCCHITWLIQNISNYHSYYCHQTWQGGHKQWGFPTYKVKWSFIHVVLWDHETNSMRYIFFTCTELMATKHGKVLIYHEELPSIKSSNSVYKRSREDTWQV